MNPILTISLFFVLLAQTFGQMIEPTPPHERKFHVSRTEAIFTAEGKKAPTGLQGEFSIDLYSIKKVYPLPEHNAIGIVHHDDSVSLISLRGWKATEKVDGMYKIWFDGEALGCFIYQTSTPGVPSCVFRGTYNSKKGLEDEPLLKFLMTLFPPKFKAA